MMSSLPGAKTQWSFDLLAKTKAQYLMKKFNARSCYPFTMRSGRAGVKRGS